MSHLSFETIARLVDEQPSALDNAHLEACATCRAELAAMRADIDALGDLQDIAPPAGAWKDIESRLAAEGLLTAGTDVAPAASRSYGMLARAAAIGAIFVGGALVGRALETTPVAAPAIARATGSGEAPETTDAPKATSSEAVPSPTPQTLAQPERPVRLASTGDARSTTAPRAAANNGDDPGDAALRDLRSAEDMYFSALKKFSEKGTVANDPTARLAALEGIVLTTRAALAQAPTDPVINGYHLTALAQRDAMLKQIRATPATSW